MNFQNTDKISKVILSVGDESGIGPEIILKALCSNQIPKNIEAEQTILGSILENNELFDEIVRLERGGSLSTLGRVKESHLMTSIIASFPALRRPMEFTNC